MEQNHGTNFLAISILAAAVIIGGSFIYGNSIKGGGGSTAVVAEAGREREAGVAPAPVDINKLLDDDVILGNRKASVKIVEFGDFQCPYCKQLFDKTEKELRREYISTDKVMMVYRDFPLDSIHPYARRAAEAAECSRDQGKYWVYHDMLFDKQSMIPTMDFVNEAKNLGLDSNQFKQCVDAGKYKAEVEKDYQDGIVAGVQGTPGVFVNDKFFPGALPYETFKAAIEEELKKVQ